MKCICQECKHVWVGMVSPTHLHVERFFDLPENPKLECPECHKMGGIAMYHADMFSEANDKGELTDEEADYLMKTSKSIKLSAGFWVWLRNRFGLNRN